jgi:hypothetical protein
MDPMNEPGVECPKYLARAQRIGGVMVDDLGLVFVPIVILCVFLSKFVSDFVIVPVALVGMGIAWSFLKVTTAGKPDGKFNLWRHKVGAGSIQGLPKGVKQPVIYNSNPPVDEGKKDHIYPRRPKPTQEPVWALGRQEFREEDESSELISHTEKTTLSGFYLEIGLLEARFTRLRLISVLLLISCGFIFYQLSVLAGTKRPAFFFEGTTEPGFAEIQYVPDFDKEAWVTESKDPRTTQQDSKKELD